MKLKNKMFLLTGVLSSIILPIATISCSNDNNSTKTQTQKNKSTITTETTTEVNTPATDINAKTNVETDTSKEENKSNSIDEILEKYKAEKNKVSLTKTTFDPVEFELNSNVEAFFENLPGDHIKIVDSSVKMTKTKTHFTISYDIQYTKNEATQTEKITVEVPITVTATNYKYNKAIDFYKNIEKHVTTKKESYNNVQSITNDEIITKDLPTDITIKNINVTPNVEGDYVVINFELDLKLSNTETKTYQMSYALKRP
ncbi:hypothetical protein [Mycoplasma sp. OR1901]|uniref:hypothetical protein n=1 Tax=Mycoplasma sp. OR1901 TaxID=2742195 RepID=UPI001583F07F|nr:hypothetical protein [Mycoplasma sp. OR1901]QKT05429.1 hypothetical protein HTZ87_01795 [Mycoplasma sp. OR1901]